MTNGVAEDPRVKHLVEAWKTTIGVQQHFNDIELRIRNYALTSLLAVTGAAGIALKEGVAIVLWGQPVSLASALLLAGLAVHCAFYFMDQFWYHSLLKGAVEYGQNLEKELTALVPGGTQHGSFALTAAISRHSPMSVGPLKLHSNVKMNIFYGAITVLLVLGVVASWHGATANDGAAATPCCSCDDH